MPDTVLQRLYKFKAAFVSSSLPDNILLELIESYINSDSDDVTSGLSLSSTASYHYLIQQVRR